MLHFSHLAFTPAKMCKHGIGLMIFGRVHVVGFPNSTSANCGAMSIDANLLFFADLVH